MDKIRNQKLLRFLSLIFVVTAILLLEHPLSRILKNGEIAHLVTVFAAFASIPILYWVWRVGEEKPPSFAKWTIVLVLMVGLIALPNSSSWRNDHPRLDDILMGWLLPAVVILFCLVVRLRGTNKTS